MRRNDFKHDWTMMYVMHDALRRELDHLARVAADHSEDPRDVIGTSLGWQMFKDYLHIHHGAEDDVLWPAIRRRVAGDPDELAVIEAMDAEHAVVDPGLAAIDAALAAREAGPERLVGIVERLVEGLGRHLEHEEDEALAVIDRYATPELLRRFGAEHAQRVGARMPQYMPWLLDGANEEDVATALRPLPEHLKPVYRDVWLPAYVGLNRWEAKSQ